MLHVENLDHHAEITVKAGRFLLRGTGRSQDMYASIDAAADRIERQLKKHKEKLTNHKANGHAATGSRSRSATTSSTSSSTRTGRATGS